MYQVIVETLGLPNTEATTTILTVCCTAVFMQIFVFFTQFMFTFLNSIFKRK